jgi:hypothetical protein
MTMSVFSCPGGVAHSTAEFDTHVDRVHRVQPTATPKERALVPKFHPVTVSDEPPVSGRFGG